MGQLEDLMERFVTSVERMADAAEKRAGFFERQILINEDKAGVCPSEAEVEEAPPVAEVPHTSTDAFNAVVNTTAPPAVAEVMANAEVAVPAPTPEPNPAEVKADRASLLAEYKRCYKEDPPSGTRTSTLVKKIDEYNKIAAVVAPVAETAPPVAEVPVEAAPVATAPPVVASAPPVAAVPVASVPVAAAPVAQPAVAQPVVAAAPAAPSVTTVVTGEPATVTTLSSAITELYQAKGVDIVKGVFTFFGATDLSSIPAERYDEVMQKLLEAKL